MEATSLSGGLMEHEAFPYVSGEFFLSKQARSLWGKSDGDEGACWLPLYMHMLDSEGIAGRLWDEWLPEGTRATLIRALGGEPRQARRLACFIAGAHDIGKATPSFQGMPCGRGGLTLEHIPSKAGLPFGEDIKGHRVSHPVASCLILLDVLVNVYGWDVRGAKSVAAVVGCHHGKPPADKDVPNRIREEELPQAQGLGWDEESAGRWESVQKELIALVARAVGLTSDDLAALGGTFVPAPAASLLTGLVIMADWLASDQGLFPYVSRGYDDEDIDADRLRLPPSTWEDVARQVSRAWGRAGLIPAWHEDLVSGMSIDDLYRERFGFLGSMRPRPVQQAAVEAALSVETPGLMIIEAPMGEGKTEAALAAAEVLAARTGRGGVCMALPTMATTDAMFGRVHRWIERLPHDGGSDARSMFLAHGKARLNEEFQGLRRIGGRRAAFSMAEDLQEGGEAQRSPSDSAVVSQWMQGRKKGMLANFVVCTVDQVLMGALEMKHLSLRQLSLANKVVVIDECHAYDSYMRCYLNRVLGWLGAMGVPVVLLSATLPIDQRHEMLESYLSGQCAAPVQVSARGAKRKRPPRFSDSEGSSAVGTSASLQGTAAAPAVSDTQAQPTGAQETSAYPLITYTDGTKGICSVDPDPSDRSLEVGIALAEDGDDDLVALLEGCLKGGGCAGVICTTVTRAQHAAQVLRSAFGHDAVVLAHSRFTDLDRMASETRLRNLLGPEATRENGKRPERLIVVGTQVLEQSLDIDFDVLVSDVAPIDLAMQRLGRLHRHRRQRPCGLEAAVCYIRGIETWEEDGPVFSKGVATVYPAATLLETLGILGLTDEGTSCTVGLPADIARTVRDAYGDKVALPQAWRERYEKDKGTRVDEVGRKKAKAGACLLRDGAAMVRQRETLVNWYKAKDLETRDQDYGPRAVRDTGETVEVLLLELRGEEVHLLPWIGCEGDGVELGAQVATAWVPDDVTAQLAAQSAVRLPQSLCKPDRIEQLIGELEEACGRFVGSWQESPWLAGCLPLLLRRDEAGRLGATVGGQVVTYDRDEGLTVRRGEVGL